MNTHLLKQLTVALCTLFLLFSSLSTLSAQEDAKPATPAFPAEAKSTGLILGPESNPRAVVELKLIRPLKKGGYFQCKHLGPSFSKKVEDSENETGALIRLPAPLRAEGKKKTIEIEAVEGDQRSSIYFEYWGPAADWTLHFIPGFHYDPVWWNTQAHYTETGRYMDAHVGPGLELVERYLDQLDRDKDYRVSLHQLPYIKTFVEARPAHTARLLAAIASGRSDLVGGTYNELSTSLISAESTARNAIYGSLFHTEILKGDASVFWQCDVFGHDPSFPSVMKLSGHETGAFARGPFHQWGAPRDQVNFPSEFYWMAPDGEQILTHYMTGHYGYAYGQFAPGSNHAPDDHNTTEAMIAAMFADLGRVSLTHNVLLPMHMDFVRPLDNLGEVLRNWNARYVSPKAIMTSPQEFFAKVKQEVKERGIEIPVITRDMGPIYTGCAVSFADLKLAQRECESRLREAEAFATIAALLGHPYPKHGLDRAWRQLLFNSHHDGVTGSMSDQVYIDLLYSYRDALDIALKIRDRAIDLIEQHIHTRSARGWLAWNPIVQARSEQKKFEEKQTVGAFGCTGKKGQEIKGLVVPQGLTQLENKRFRVSVDLKQGGCISSIYDKQAKRELLKGMANDIVVYEEYPVLPGHGEGPWHISPTGKSWAGTASVARLEESTRPNELIVVADYPEFSKRQVIFLPHTEDRIEFKSEILNWRGANKLLRVEFPFDLPGARPVYQTAAAVIGRSFARDVDTAEDSWTLDQTCWQWAGLGSVCQLDVVDENGKTVNLSAIGVGEIVLPYAARSEDWQAAARLAKALVQAGVTTTTTEFQKRRYGDIQYDSNLPDFRIYLVRGHLDKKPLEESYDRALEAIVGELDTGKGPKVSSICISLAPVVQEQLIKSIQEDRRVVVRENIAQKLPVETKFQDYGVAILNRGVVSTNIQPDGTIGLNLLRSCTSWPAGVWIDPPSRALPDGAALETMHGSHSFEYSLVPHSGDFRKANVSQLAQEYQHPVIWKKVKAHDGELRPDTSFIEFSEPGVLLTAFKVHGNGPAKWQDLGKETERPSRVSLRLFNGTGRALTNKVKTLWPITGAYRSNLLEEIGEAIKVEDGSVSLDLQPNALITIVLDLELKAKDILSRSYEPRAGDRSPSEYWLENRSEGVTGNGAISIVPDVRHVKLGDKEVRIPITIINNQQDRSAELPIQIKYGQDLKVSIDPPYLKLKPGSNAKATLKIRQLSSKKHRSLVTLSTAGFAGGSISTGIWVERGEHRGDPVVIENSESVVSGQQENSKMIGVIFNNTDAEIEGLATWISPMQLWESTPEWQQEIRIPARSVFHYSIPLNSKCSSFAMLRFAYGGRVAYGESIAILDKTTDCFLSCDIERLRISADGNATLVIHANSINGLSEKSKISIDCPKGWKLKESNRRFRGESETQKLSIAYQIEAKEAALRGRLSITGPGGSSASIAYSKASQQLAGRGIPDVKIDGDISEWDPKEFTHASGKNGKAKMAVRYGAGALLFALEAEDKDFLQGHSGGSIWRADSMQIALSVFPSTEIGYGHRDLEFGAALTNSGPMVWCWYGGEGGKTGLVQEATVAITYSGGKVTYEMLLPRSVLPKLQLEPGAVLGFSYIANDDDGKGYQGATEWTGGMTGSKDSSLFGELKLVK